MKVRVNGRDGEAFSVEVGVHQGLVLSSLLIIIKVDFLFEISEKACLDETALLLLLLNR